MKKHLFALALTGTLIATSAATTAGQTATGMSDMSGMQHDAKPAEAHGVGVLKAIDAVKGTVTLQHEAIAAIGWPAMTMPFKLASPELLKNVKIGDKVQFTLRLVGVTGTVMSIDPVQ